jgi:NadR type nicotinamide-nucleotide adenylyltransferase
MTHPIKRIAITGPESTGKSMLAGQLADYYHTVYVHEYAREYIDNLNRPYLLNDIIAIAKGQLENENRFAKKAQRLLFCDSDFIVLKIWCEFKYNTCPEWILDKVNNHIYDLYLLMDIDLPWESDPQREHPHLRELLFNLYKDELAARKLPFRIISGLGNYRLKNAIKAVDEEIASRK